jgi:hypothetical protein
MKTPMADPTTTAPVAPKIQVTRLPSGDLRLSIQGMHLLMSQERGERLEEILELVVYGSADDAWWPRDEEQNSNG